MSFDPARARTKRPLPLWCDAFMRDTQHFEADEIGAYMRILMAMWSSRDLVLPDDPRRLARAAGVSFRLWKGRIGPVIMPLLTPCEGGVTQGRLAREAAYVEHQLAQQSARRKKIGNGTDPDPDDKADTKRRGYPLPQRQGSASPEYDPVEDANPFINQGPDQSADTSTDTSTDQSADTSAAPTILQPNNQDKRVVGRARARASGRPTDAEVDAVHQAAGVDFSKRVLDGWVDMHVVQAISRWKAAGLTLDEILQVLAAVSASRQGEPPPATPAYFDPAIRRAARRKAMAHLKPIEGGKTDEPRYRPTAAERRKAIAEEELERDIEWARSLDRARGRGGEDAG